MNKTRSHVLQGNRQGVHGCEQDQWVHSRKDGVLPHAGDLRLVTLLITAVDMLHHAFCPSLLLAICLRDA